MHIVVFMLKAQADERARRLKEELEKKRKEAYDLEQKRLQLQRWDRVNSFECCD